MQTVSFKVTDEMLRKMDELVEEGYFIHRSDLIRYAIRMLIEEYEKMKKKKVETIRP